MSDVMKRKGNALEAFGRVCRRFALPLLVTASPLAAAAQGPGVDPAYELYKKTRDKEMANFKGTEQQRQEHEEAMRLAFIRSYIAAQGETSRTDKATPAEIDYNDVLREHSKKSFLQIYSASKNHYSHYLDSLNQSTEHKIQAAHHAGRQAYTIDPLAVDIGKSLGYSTEEAVQILLDFEGIKYTQGELNSLTKRLKMTVTNAAGNKMNDPGAMQLTLNSDVSIIIPASDFGTPNALGMGIQQYITYVNLHEAFHAMDTLYVPRYGAEAGYTHDAESVADVYALGEMIRKGAPLEIMDGRHQWALHNAYTDTTHSSMHSIQGLKDLLQSPEEMRRFQRMDHDEAVKLYYSITHNTGMVGNGFLTIKDYLDSFSTSYKPADLSSLAHHGHSHEAEAKAPAFPSFGESLTADQQQKVRDAAYDWNAPLVLAERCFKDHGRMTPETRAQAYGDIHNEVSRELRKETTLEGITLQMEKLRELRLVFLQSGHLDFVAINKDRGVDLTQTERCLRDAQSGEKYASAPSSAKSGTLDLTAHFTPLTPGR